MNKTVFMNLSKVVSAFFATKIDERITKLVFYHERKNFKISNNPSSLKKYDGVSYVLQKEYVTLVEYSPRWLK